jgi:outer membrane protein OmpA-like peptidoglycan-associated protein
LIHSHLKIDLLIICSFILVGSNAQNLVANGSFEDLNTCYEFKANCSPAAWFVVDSRDPFHVKPVSGTRSLSFTFGNIHDSQLKTFPYTRVLCPLVPGNKYTLKIWVNCGDFEFTHMDVLLSKTDPTRIKKSGDRLLFTFRFNKMDIADKKADGWQLLEKTFSITEVSNFLLLGNLSGDDFPKSDQKIARRYQGDIIYSIDDISLTNVDSLSNKCPQFDEVTAELYAETHRHTSFVYLDAKHRTLKVREVTRNEAGSPGSAAKSIRNTDTLVMQDFIFKTGSSQINVQYYKILDSLVKFIQNRKVLRIDIKGYTDDVGSDEINEKLSLTRAEAVKKYILTSLPELKNILHSNGYGKKNPISPNTSDNNRAKNRRVEIIIAED